MFRCWAVRIFEQLVDRCDHPGRRRHCPSLQFNHVAVGQHFTCSKRIAKSRQKQWCATTRPLLSQNAVSRSGLRVRLWVRSKHEQIFVSNTELVELVYSWFGNIPPECLLRLETFDGRILQKSPQAAKEDNRRTPFLHQDTLTGGGQKGKTLTSTSTMSTFSQPCLLSHQAAFRKVSWSGPMSASRSPAAYWCSLSVSHPMMFIRPWRARSLTDLVTATAALRSRRWRISIASWSQWTTSWGHTSTLLPENSATRSALLPGDSLASRPRPSDVLASGDLCIVNGYIRDRPFPLDSRPSRIGSSAWFLSCVFWVCLQHGGNAALARSASFGARPLALPTVLFLVLFSHFAWRRELLLWFFSLHVICLELHEDMVLECFHRTPSLFTRAEAPRKVLTMTWED